MTSGEDTGSHQDRLAHQLDQHIEYATALLRKNIACRVAPQLTDFPESGELY